MHIAFYQHHTTPALTLPTRYPLCIELYCKNPAREMGTLYRTARRSGLPRVYSAVVRRCLTNVCSNVYIYTALALRGARACGWTGGASSHNSAGHEIIFSTELWPLWIYEPISSNKLRITWNLAQFLLIIIDILWKFDVKRFNKRQDVPLFVIECNNIKLIGSWVGKIQVDEIWRAEKRTNFTWRACQYINCNVATYIVYCGI